MLDDVLEDDDDALLALDDIDTAPEHELSLNRIDDELVLGNFLLSGTSRLAQTRSYIHAAHSGMSARQPADDEFGLNACAIHECGALLLDAQDAAVAWGELAGPVATTRQAAVPLLAPAPMILDSPDAAGVAAAHNSSPPPADFGDVDDYDGGFDQPPMPVTPVAPPRPALARIAARTPALPTPADTEADDPWQFLNPHSTAGMPPDKPARAARSFRSAAAVRARMERTESAKAALEDELVLLFDRQPLPLRGVALPEFASARRKAVARLRKQRLFFWGGEGGGGVCIVCDTYALVGADKAERAASNESNENDVEDDEPDVGDEPGDVEAAALMETGFGDADGAGFGNDDDNDMGGFGDGGFGDDSLMADADNGVLVADEAVERVLFAREIAEAATVPEESYEELCRRHVESYMSTANSYLAQTKLSRRIAEWTGE